MLYWITGLPGAGKTAIGKALYNKLKPYNQATVLLDGDELRGIVGDRFGYTVDERRECSMFYAQLCKLLADQSIDVICCVCALFENVRRWNRENIEDYIEIFVNPPINVIRERNQKGLYTGDETDAYGVGIRPELPTSPDVVLINDGSLTVGEQADIILKGREK